MLEKKQKSFSKGVCGTLSKLFFYKSSLAESGLLLDGQLELLEKLLADKENNYLVMPYAESTEAPAEYQSIVNHPCYRLVQQYLRKETVDRLYGLSLRKEFHFSEFEEYLFWLQALISGDGAKGNINQAEKAFLEALKTGEYPLLLSDIFTVIVFFFEEIEDKEAVMKIFEQKKLQLEMEVKQRYFPCAACGF